MLVVMNENLERAEALHVEIQKLTTELKGLLKAEAEVDVGGYTFSSTGGDVSLLDLFGEKDDLIVIHNMGKRCVYCTTYADGINGVLHHLENRCAVALLSPDPVSEQKDFAFSRAWKFRMISMIMGRDSTRTWVFTSPRERWRGCGRGSAVFTGMAQRLPARVLAILTQGMSTVCYSR